MTIPLRLFAFNCGWFQCKPGFFIEGDTGTATDTAYVRSPIPAYLIEHPTGRALFETGRGLLLHPTQPRRNETAGFHL